MTEPLISSSPVWLMQWQSKSISALSRRFSRAVTVAVRRSPTEVWPWKARLPRRIFIPGPGSFVPRTPAISASAPAASIVLALDGRGRSIALDVERIDVARDNREYFDVGLREGPSQACRIADYDFVERQI